jgi:hypothetical protein
MENQRIGFELSKEEYERLEALKGKKTWRELFLNSLGISTERKQSGPKRVG